MQGDTAVHFGHFVHRLRGKKSLAAFGAEVGVGEKRMWEIEQMPTPQVSETTLAGLAEAAKMTVEDFEKAWRSTKVRKPNKHGPGRPHPTRIIRVPANTYTQLEQIAAWNNHADPTALIIWWADHATRARSTGPVAMAPPAFPPKGGASKTISQKSGGQRTREHRVHEEPSRRESAQ